jgi:hypothetical protein|tara:strand:- start:748 stop:939 length:192 start_codon:yes stop_codon:yes gene_type:complete
MTEAALLTVDEAVAEIFTEFSTSNRKRLYALIKAGEIETIRPTENGRYFIPRRAIAALRGDDE